MNTLIVFTDGCCFNNGKYNSKASYAVYFPNKEYENISGCLKGKHTNNRAELTAILICLQQLKYLENTIIKIYSDSKYSINSLTVWYKKWEQDNWINSKKQQVLNSDLIKQILNLSNDLKKNNNIIQYNYVKAHTNKTDEISKCNNIVDLLAKQACK